MSNFLQDQPTSLAEYDEQLVRRLIEKVTVYKDKFTVEFKSGVTVDVNEPSSDIYVVTARPGHWS